MVLRLALRMAKHRGVELSMEVFAAAARFRGLTPHTELQHSTNN
jgi:hypothetical protein